MKIWDSYLAILVCIDISFVLFFVFTGRSADLFRFNIKPEGYRFDTVL